MWCCHQIPDSDPSDPSDSRTDSRLQHASNEPLSLDDTIGFEDEDEDEDELEDGFGALYSDEFGEDEEDEEEEEEEGEEEEEEEVEEDAGVKKGSVKPRGP